MIITVSLNPSIDKSVTVGQFVYGGMNRVAASRMDAGGKAINVAAVTSALGLPTACVGFLATREDEIIRRRLSDCGVEQAFYPIEGRVRTCMKLLDASSAVVTEINEPGEPVTPAALSALRELVARRVRPGDSLVLTGSLPPECPKDYYKTMIETVAGRGCFCVLDAEGEAFTRGVLANPHLIKPNRMELETAQSCRLESVSDVARAALDYCRRGVEIVAVSLGGEGALIASGEAVYFADALSVPVRSTVGAGDSMVAGMLWAKTRGLSLPEILKTGVACATASVMLEGTELADRVMCERLMEKITVRKV